MEIYAAPKLSKYKTALGAYNIKSFTYQRNQHTHACARASARTHTHPHTHTHTHTHTTHTHARTHARTHTRARYRKFVLRKIRQRNKSRWLKTLFKEMGFRSLKFVFFLSFFFFVCFFVFVCLFFSSSGHHFHFHFHFRFLRNSSSSPSPSSCSPLPFFSRKGLTLQRLSLSEVQGEASLFSRVRVVSAALTGYLQRLAIMTSIGEAPCGRSVHDNKK